MTPTRQPKRCTNADAAVDAVLDLVGHEIVLGLPLGLGKANHFANAMFARACNDSSIQLSILTALTLERPRPSSDLERRFLEPFVERVFEDYPALTYVDALRKGTLPDNIHVSEFFLLTGAWLSNPVAQQGYTSTNYTHASRDLLAAGCNVVAQLVDRRDTADRGERFSLSCNPEMTLDVMPAMRKRAGETGKPVALVGEVNERLPFMFNDADVGADFFDVVLDTGAPYFQLFSTPHQPIDVVDYAAGFHAASLVQDGGTLQIGIGSLADAIARCLILRHQSPDEYAKLLDTVPTQHEWITRERGSFDQGLYGSSEMVVDGFVDLIEAGVLKRRVFEDMEQQRRHMRGESLPGGFIMHGGFFVGSRSMYDRLNAMPDEQRALINMTNISFTNQLYGQEELKRLQRQKGRFINTAMMVTLNGAAISDGLDDGRVVSGVGGQYNFVAMAHELEGAKSILIVRSTRTKGGDVLSNFRWSYGHCTIPRHLRDVYVSEYGIADVRGKSDRDCVASLLNITDSRFQDSLLAEAKASGKIEKGYAIPDRWRQNTPARLQQEFGDAITRGLLPRFPFGTDLNEDELALGKALNWLKTQTATRWDTLTTIGAAMTTSVDSANERTARLLKRMGFDQTSSAKERVYSRLVAYAIQKTRD